VGLRSLPAATILTWLAGDRGMGGPAGPLKTGNGCHVEALTFVAAAVTANVQEWVADQSRID
jgi:hypothetical protein